VSPETAGQRDGRYSVAEATRLKEHARPLSERAKESFLSRSILPFTRRPSVTPYPDFLLKTANDRIHREHWSRKLTENRELFPI